MKTKFFQDMKMTRFIHIAGNKNHSKLNQLNFEIPLFYILFINSLVEKLLTRYNVN